jgi:hypothetical protein
LARREAHYDKKPLNHHSKGRLLKRKSQAAARKEGARGGTRGSPTKRGAAEAAPSRYIIPPISGMPAGAAGCFSGGSATIASVVRMFFAIEAAF